MTLPQSSDSGAEVEGKAAPLPRLSDLLLAFGALTPLPLRRPDPQSVAFAPATLFFPLVGLLIGGLLVGLNWAIAGRLPQWLASVLLVGAWEATRAGARATPATSAGTALIKIVGLTLATRWRGMALLFGPMLGPWCLVVLATGARDRAAPGRKFNAAITFREFALTSILTFAVVFAIAEAAGILLVVCAAAATLVVRLLAHRWLGGISWSFLLGCARAIEALVVALCALL